jgi:hypothetical protein
MPPQSTLSLVAGHSSGLKFGRDLGAIGVSAGGNVARAKAAYPARLPRSVPSTCSWAVAVGASRSVTTGTLIGA